MKSLKTLFHPSASYPRKPKVYVDASTFDPDQACGGEAVILRAQNDADCITKRVSDALQSAAGVVVVDQGSSDGTPILAAQAGAVVVLQEPGQSWEDVIQKAKQIARRFSDHIRVCI